MIGWRATVRGLALWWSGAVGLALFGASLVGTGDTSEKLFGGHLLTFCHLFELTYHLGCWHALDTRMHG
jgi:hypothetical protein